MERFPGWRPHVFWLADLVAGQGDIERARRLMADAFPEFREDGLELPRKVLFEEDYDLAAAMAFAAILNANGEAQRRDALLLALEERIATMHRTRGVGYGILDVYIHAMRGDRDRAIAGLREGIDMGWRPGIGWPALRTDWRLANLHQDPGFIAIMDELEAGVRRQRQWYEDHKDEPLF